MANEARGPRWFSYPGNLSAFLADTLAGVVRPPIFPEDFPCLRPTFTPYDR